MNSLNVKATKKFALEIRYEVMKMLVNRGFGHVGGCLSCVDLFAVLYNDIMEYDPKKPNLQQRDRLIISKGHAGPTAYAVLSLKGFFPKEWMLTLNEGGTRLPSHCDKIRTPGIDFTTGSLGQGLSLGVGAAYAVGLDKMQNDVFILLGDGETQEGQICEAAMSAAKFKLDNLYCFVDRNKYQVDGATEDIMPLINIAEKFKAFGWHTQEINGHDVQAIYSAINEAKKIKNKPCAIIMDTVKGYGNEEIVNMNYLCHHMSIPQDLGKRVVEDLENQLKKY